MSIGLHSAPAGAGSVSHRAELCDAAEGGRIFISPATASLLEGEDLGELSVRELGEVETRRTGRRVRAYELVVPSVAS